MLEGSRFVVFPGAGHEPHLHDPDRFVTLVADHLHQ
jgi:pimeloyl-ACP methyl ester carboxylesterase